MRFWLTIGIVLLTALTARGQEVFVLGVEDMAAAVQREFVEQGITEQTEVEFFGGQTEFVLDNTAEAKILVSHLETDAEQNKFTAEAEIFADGRPAGKTKLFGRYFVITETWVPAKDIDKGAVIKAEDLKRIAIRANRLRNETVTAKEDLVGRQTVRAIKAEKPITSRDIREEIVIKRNQEVTAVYHYKGLQITSKLEAQEDGARGQRIKLLNTKSGKEVIGKVIDKNTVEIAAE